MSYKDVIDSFDVVNNPDYQQSGDETYCNFFAQDVMDAMGQSHPSGDCATMLNNLYGNVDPHWKSVSADYYQYK